MTEPTPASASRSARRAATRKKRRNVIVAVAVVLLLAAGGVVVFSGGGEEQVAKAEPVATTTTTTIPPTTTTTIPAAASVATTKVPDLQVFDAPGGTRVLTSFSAKTEYLAPRTLLVTEQQGEWLKALLPMRPNQSEGWIRTSDVTLSQNPYKIVVDLAAHELVFTKDGQEILRTGIVGGAPRTPTPLGTYYITDPVDLRTRPGGAYGAYALGLSGYSDVLLEFNGGPGQIAIHGTNNPELIGQDVSNGCIRVDNTAAVAIATQAPLGTPVVIR
ncbi:MAG: L,D-transpeptidase [Actinobacteria bacterium]|nr:L,D-transpeptidase [Actinomycetota bacterium]